MSGFFRRRLKRSDSGCQSDSKVVAPITLAQEKVAVRIAEWILAFQRRAADQLNTKAQKVNKKLLLVLLIGLGLLFGGYCFWLIRGIFI